MKTGKFLTSIQQDPEIACGCCGEKFDRRVARVETEHGITGHKGMCHYVCPKCFEKIRVWYQAGLPRWGIIKWTFRGSPAWDWEIWLPDIYPPYVEEFEPQVYPYTGSTGELIQYPIDDSQM